MSTPTILQHVQDGMPYGYAIPDAFVPVMDYLGLRGADNLPTPAYTHMDNATLIRILALNLFGAIAPEYANFRQSRYMAQPAPRAMLYALWPQIRERLDVHVFGQLTDADRLDVITDRMTGRALAYYYSVAGDGIALLFTIIPPTA